MEVSSGTYIRALARDIGERLGMGAYLKELRRTRVGKAKVEEAMRLDSFSKTNWELMKQDFLKNSKK